MVRLTCADEKYELQGAEALAVSVAEKVKDRRMGQGSLIVPIACARAIVPPPLGK